MNPESFLQSFVNLERTGEFAYARTLDRMRDLLSHLGSPQRMLPRIITVAGSKGKGTTAMMIERILRAHGLTTGLYLSPHVERWNERIQENGIPVSDEVISALIHKHRVVLTSKTSTGEMPTYFEAVTALAFLFFKQQALDVIVLEVGLGGKYDATNVCDADIAVITPISLEHTKILGNTLAQIAGEKSGIIKPHSAVITSRQSDEVLSVIQKAAAPRSVEVIHESWGGALGLEGRQYRENAALAMRAAQSHLKEIGLRFDANKAENALRDFSPPGRMQVISKNPLVIVDGAHNGESAQRLVEALRESFEFRRVFLICGMMRDKLLEDFLTPLRSLPLTAAYAVPLSSQRALEPQVLADAMKDILRVPVETSSCAADALSKALEQMTAEDLVLAAGSLYLAGDVAKTKRT